MGLYRRDTAYKREKLQCERYGVLPERHTVSPELQTVHFFVMIGNHIVIPTMKRINALALCLFLLSQKGNAQQYLIDSLGQILPSTKEPIQKIDVLLGLTRASLFALDQKKAHNYVLEAYKLSQINQYPDGKAMSLLFLEDLNLYTPSNTETDYLQDAIKIEKSHPSKSLAAFVAYHLAERYIYKRNDYTTGISILREALQQVDNTVPDKHIGNLHKVLGVAYSIAGDSAKTFDHFEKALYYFNRVKTHPFVAPELGRPSYMDADGGTLNKIQVLNYLSREYYNQGKYQKAMGLLGESLAMAQQNQAGDLIAWTEDEMAINYTAIGLFDKAIEMYQNAIRFYEKKQSPFALAFAVKEVGSLFFHLGDYQIAEVYFKRALSIKQKTSDSIGMQEIYQRLGQVENYLNRPNQAMRYYEAAALLNAQLKDSTTLSQILMGKGNILQKQGKYALALENYRKGLEIDQHFNQEPLVINDLIILSRLFLQTNQLDSAGHYTEIAQGLALNGSLEHQALLEELQSQISEQKGDYVQALSHYKKFYALHDQIFSSNSQEKLKQEQVRQNIDDYQKEKDQAKREAALLNVQNRLYLVLTLAFLAIILTGGYLLIRLRKAQNLLKAQNLQLQQLNQTKDRFFGIIAHDIRSPMVALEGVGEQMTYYLKNQRIDKLERLANRVDKTARQLGNLLDNLLNWALLQQGIIPYQPQALNINKVSTEVLEMFKANAEAKNIQLENHISRHLVVNADVYTLHAILRNLLSNAIKFTPAGGKVSISTEQRADKALININDTGTGIAVEKLEKLFSIDKTSENGTAGEKGTGLGLLLVKELVELNKGHVQVASKLNEGSSFTISLPLAS